MPVTQLASLPLRILKGRTSECRRTSLYRSNIKHQSADLLSASRFAVVFLLFRQRNNEISFHGHTTREGEKCPRSIHSHH